MVTLYNVQSQDGFIADENGSEDFIPDDLWPKTIRFLKRFDRIVLSRKSYEAIQKYSNEMRNAFETLSVEKFVVTKNRNFKTGEGYMVVDTPEEALDPTLNCVVTGGRVLNEYLLQHNFVHKIVYHEVPIKIGNGMPAYTSIPARVAVERVEGE